jgi:dihydrofolate synthase/folylpolyglutamate synthase
MTEEEALGWWSGHVNYEQRPPVSEDLKLDRMRGLLARLGDPHRFLRIVHITGSKGKGSVAAMLASVLQQAGYRTGLFTSPHLVNVEERFQVAGEPISRAELTQLLCEVRQAVGGTPESIPTFFEIGTAVGFLHFWRRRVEAAVIEVGLGGRLDSTNVCSSVVSVITSISFDHVKILGNTLARIAWEKAGIIKPRRPVISGVPQPEPASVIASVAAARGAPLRQAGRDFTFQSPPATPREPFSLVQVRTALRTWPMLRVGLLGPHQAANASVAVATVEELQRLGWTIPDTAVQRGLEAVHWPARMELIRVQPPVLLDCAHNAASAEALVQTLQTAFPTRPRVLVFASSNDKDVAGMFAHLRDAFDEVIFTRYTTNPRAVPPRELAEQWGGGQVIESPHEAVRVAMQNGGFVCVTGSIFLAGEVRPLLIEQAKPNMPRAS